MQSGIPHLAQYLIETLNITHFRLALEKKRQVSPSPDSRPFKRRRLSRVCHGIEADDMSLITDENYSSHPVCHGICADRNCENRLSKAGYVSAVPLLEADINPLEL